MDDDFLATFQALAKLADRDTFRMLELPLEIRTKIYVEYLNMDLPWQRPKTDLWYRPYSRHSDHQIYQNDEDPWNDDFVRWEPKERRGHDSIKGSVMLFGCDGQERSFRTQDAVGSWTNYRTTRLQVPALWQVPVVGNEARREHLRFGFHFNILANKGENRHLTGDPLSLIQAFGDIVISSLRRVDMSVDYNVVGVPRLARVAEERQRMGSLLCPHHMFYEWDCPHWHVLYWPSIVNCSGPANLRLQLNAEKTVLQINTCALLSAKAQLIFQNLLEGWLENRPGLQKFNGRHLLEVTNLLDMYHELHIAKDKDGRRTFCTFQANDENTTVEVKQDEEMKTLRLKVDVSVTDWAFTVAEVHVAGANPLPTNIENVPVMSPAISEEPGAAEEDIAENDDAHSTPLAIDSDYDHDWDGRSTDSYVCEFGSDYDRLRSEAIEQARDWWI